MSKHTLKPLVVILGHGSRRPEGQETIKETAVQYQKRHPEYKVVHAFMEFAEPTLSACVDKVLEEEQVSDIYIAPLFLALGNHVVHHMPENIAELEARHPNKRFRLASPLGADPLLCDIIDRRLSDVWHH